MKKNKIDTSTTSPLRFALLKVRRLYEEAYRHLEESSDLHAVAVKALDEAIDGSSGSVQPAPVRASFKVTRAAARELLKGEREAREGVARAVPAASAHGVGRKRAKRTKNSRCEHEWGSPSLDGNVYCEKCQKADKAWFRNPPSSPPPAPRKPKG